MHDDHDEGAPAKGSFGRGRRTPGGCSLSELARQVDSSVILYDRDLPGLEWQKGIPKLVSARSTPCLILLSDVSDPCLWDELVQHGGFDVFTRPFQREEVLAMLDFACMHWKSRWPSRTNEQFEALA